MKSVMVFISHTSHDQTIAGLVCQALEQRHIACWIAPRDIDVGEIWDDAIVNGIKTCQIVVLIFSSGTNDSVHVKREIHLAFDKGKLVIPFRVEDVKPEGGLEYLMMGVQWLDAVVPPLDHHLKLLVDRVEAIVAAEAQAHVAEPAPSAKLAAQAVGPVARAYPEPFAASRTERDAELDSSLAYAVRGMKKSSQDVRSFLSSLKAGQASINNWEEMFERQDKAARNLREALVRLRRCSSEVDVSTPERKLLILESRTAYLRDLKLRAWEGDDVTSEIMALMVSPTGELTGQ
jgi:hypothetical protein